MWLRFFCSSLPAGLMFGFFVFLLQPVSTQKNRNHIYFLDNTDDIVLKGPANPGNSPVVWKWKPHSGQNSQQLGTFSRMDGGSWREEWKYDRRNRDLYLDLFIDLYTLDLKIKKPTFKFSGLFTLTQIQLKKEVLKEYEIFGIQVETSPQRPVVGSDVTLSCTISRLSDTVSLHWKRVDSSQQNRTNSDQIRLNNTVYQMLRHVVEEDGKVYVCEVQENGKVVNRTKADFSVNVYSYQKHYTFYRSSTDHSDLHLICYYSYGYYGGVWTWWSSHLQGQGKKIASATWSQPINVNRANFGNRLVTSGKQFNGKDFRVRIVPVLFEDAGVYTCFLGSDTILTIDLDLITVKVTAEPSDGVTEGANVTLTCSVSHLKESMRLVWINGDGKTVGEKTLNGEEKSLTLIIQKADRGRGNWRCGLFHQNTPRLFVPFYQEPSGNRNSVYFFHQEENFVLKGPDNPGNDSIVWEWRPHSGQQITKRLATFHREDQRWAVQWSDEYSKIPGISQRMRVDWGTLHLRIRTSTFELAGVFTWTQTQPGGEILRQWEVFGIKVEADPQRPVMGSDITLSCTISRLSDTVSLHWKPRGASQQNRSNSEQIHLNNTVYLMVQHVGAGNPNVYTWEVQENGSIALTGDTNIEVDQDLHNKMYTVYRSVMDHSELDLICEASAELTETKWTWRSQHFQSQEKEIASTRKSEPIVVNRTYFGNRLGTTVGNLNGKNFNVRIFPVWFEDTGAYTCSMGAFNYVTIELITVKVTAEPSDGVSVGDTVTLTCSVSEVNESMRLVWINGDGKIVEEKIFMEQKKKGGSLQLIILKADERREKWTCGLFHQNTSKVFIPYYLQVNQYYSFKHTIVVIAGCLALLLIILAVVLGLRKCKLTGLGNQRHEPPQPKRNTEDESHLYENPNEIQQMQGINETPVPESSHVAEYMSVSGNANQEDIHYGSISFQTKASDGHRHNTQSPNRTSDYLASSKDDDSSIIYAQVAQTKI